MGGPRDTENTVEYAKYPKVVLTDSPLKEEENITSLNDISKKLEQFNEDIKKNLKKIESLGNQFSNARYHANIVKRELKKLDDTWAKRKKQDEKKTSRTTNFRVINLTDPYKKLFENSDTTRYSSESKNIFASKTENIHDEQVKKLAKVLKEYATNSDIIEKALFSALETLTNTKSKLEKATKVIPSAIKNIEKLSTIPDNDSFENIMKFLHSYIEGECKVEDPTIDFCMK